MLPEGRFCVALAVRTGCPGRGFGGAALLLPDGLMITKVLLPLSGPITWMPDWPDAPERERVTGDGAFSRAVPVAG